MTPQQLQAIKDRWAKATPGNWKWIIRGNSVQSHAVVCHDDTKSLMPQNICSGISPKTGNAQAIASAPTDIADLLAEIERLTSCLKFEQNYLSRVGTHADGCYKWGPGHWDCAVQEIERLQAENHKLRTCRTCKFVQADRCDLHNELIDNPLRDKCDKWQGVK